MKQPTRKERSLKRIQLKNNCKAGKKIVFKTRLQESLYTTPEQMHQLQVDEVNKYWDYLQKKLKIDFPMHAIDQEQCFEDGDVLNRMFTLKTTFQKV